MLPSNRHYIVDARREPDNAPDTGVSVGSCEAFYCQSSRQSGQYPVAANATPAMATRR